MARHSSSTPHSSPKSSTATASLSTSAGARGAQGRPGPLNYRNLDDLTELKGANTTTEFLTKHILIGWRRRARGKLGRAARELKSIRVTLSESHVARAWYEADLW